MTSLFSQSFNRYIVPTSLYLLDSTFLLSSILDGELMMRTKLIGRKTRHRVNVRISQRFKKKSCVRVIITHSIA